MTRTARKHSLQAHDATEREARQTFGLGFQEKELKKKHGRKTAGKKGLKRRSLGLRAWGCGFY
jgi:hypothetical protein